MNDKCKRCLLLEAGENVTHDDIMALLDTLDTEQRCNENQYRSRLQKCKECSQLISGMCRKCGCYVEYRAGIKDRHCPDADSNKC